MTRIMCQVFIQLHMDSKYYSAYGMVEVYISLSRILSFIIGNKSADNFCSPDVV